MDMHTSYYEYYKLQAEQTGAGSVFAGPMIQRGYGLGGIFRSLFSFIRPVLKPAAKFLGKTMLNTGANIVSDVAGGAKWKDTLKNRIHQAGTHIAETAGRKIGQLGKGIKRKHSESIHQLSHPRRTRRKVTTDLSKLSHRRLLDHYQDHGSYDE